MEEYNLSVFLVIVHIRIHSLIATFYNLSIMQNAKIIIMQTTHNSMDSGRKILFIVYEHFLAIK